MSTLERNGKKYAQILSKQTPGQFSSAVADGKAGEGPKIFALLPYTRHGLAEVHAIGSVGGVSSMLIYVKVVGDPSWYRAHVISFFYEVPHV